MKKIISFIFMLLILFSCKNHKQENIASLTVCVGGVIPDQYIVIMKDAFEEPVIKHRQNDPNRENQRNRNKPERDRKERKLKDFLVGKGIGSARQKMLFADVKVGAVVRIDKGTADTLRADTVNVESVIQDVSIQINPIQQSDEEASINPIQQWLSPIVPANDINPIQQDDSIQNRYDIDTVNHWTKALVTAGGPVDGTTNTSMIWFLDTGIDPSGDHLNINTALGTSFVGGGWTDNNGHGTFCAGVAAGKPIRGSATLDEIHYGIAEGATVVPVKVLDNTGTGSWGTVIAGLNYVAQLSEPGDVVNLSLGAYDPTNPNCRYPGLRNAIENVTGHGVFVTLSAGNNAGIANYNAPGCINGPNIFTTSSINADSTCAVYANFGWPTTDPIDFVTVGTRLFSIWMGGQYRMATGTSVSSALLAGIIHARNAAPASGSTVSCRGGAYPIGAIR